MKQIATLQKTKFFGPDLGKDVAADEISGNNKEDIHPNVAARETEFKVIGKHQENGDGTKTIYILPVSNLGVVLSWQTFS